MTEKKPKKEKLKLETRAPQKGGIFDNLGKGRQQNVVHPLPEIRNFPDENTLPSAGSAPSAPTQPSAPSAGTTHPVSPVRNFTKVPNSLVKEFPKGTFPGKSKQIYDYLYSVTRGAIKPTREIRMSKSSLMRGAGIKSTHTFYNNINHLENIGLIARTEMNGERAGNLYKVFIPEEINLEQVAHLAQVAHSANELPQVPEAETALGALGSNPINTDISETSNTSIKTNTNDDEAFARFNEILAAAAKRVSGKNVSSKESEQWARLAELLALELDIAAKRTGIVSSVPAFLTEVIRRQLFAARQHEKPVKAKKDSVGKADDTDYEIKPLDQRGREAALIQLREFKDDKFLMDFKKWYLEDDWNWLMENLK